MMDGGGGSNKIEETEQERAAAEVALRRYSRYQSNYVPVENKAFADVTGDASAKALERKAGGMVTADNAKAFGMAMGNSKPPLPGHGAFLTATDQTEQARGAGDIMGKVAGLGDKQKATGLQIATSIGTGQANDAQVSLGSMADAALTENIGNQEAAFNRQAARTNAIMTGVGAVARGAQGMSWGNTNPYVTKNNPLGLTPGQGL